MVKIDYQLSGVEYEAVLDHVKRATEFRGAGAEEVRAWLTKVLRREVDPIVRKYSERKATVG